MADSHRRLRQLAGYKEQASHGVLQRFKTRVQHPRDRLMIEKIIEEQPPEGLFIYRSLKVLKLQGQDWR